MSNQFAHLMKDLQVDASQTKPYIFSQIIGKPSIEFKPAIEANRDYADAMLLLAQKKGQDPNRRGKINILKEAQRARREDMALYSKYCATSWKGIKDIKGNDVKFTTKAVFEFLTALPTRMQDHLRGWLKQEVNFLPENEDEQPEFEVDDLSELSFEDIEGILDGSADEGEDDLGKSSGA